MKKFIKFLFLVFIFTICFIYINKKIINNLFKIDKDNKDILYDIFNILVKNEELNPNILLSNNIVLTNNDDKIIENKKPLVYLYNTHQTEGYQVLDNALYNFKPTVMTASYILEDLLKREGILCVVEKRSIKDVLNLRGWDYSYSYRISKEYMTDALNNNPSLKVFIDLHRDSVYDKSISTVNINGNNYAKIMFLMGQNRNNYDANLKKVKELESILNDMYPSITRNTYLQPKYSYNEEFNDDTYLIEVGTEHNTIDEVYRSMEALAKALARYYK